METKERIFWAGGVLLLVLGLSFPVQALDRATLRLDWVRYGIHAPFFLGVEKGFYKEAGIDLKVLESKGSVATIQLVGSGDDTFGFAALANLAEAVTRGIPAKSVYVITHDSAYSIISLKEAKIKTPKDLVGKSIGVSPSGTSRAVLPAFLKVNGMELSQVKEIAFEGTARFNALLMKKIDSELGPFTSNVPILEDKGGELNVLRLSDWGLSILGFGIVVSNKLIAENPDLIRRFLQATTRSIVSSKANPDEAIKAMAKDYIKPEPKVWAYDWKLELEVIESKYAKDKPLGWQPKEEWDRTQDFMGRYIDKAIGEVPLGKFYTNEFISQ